MASKQDLLTDLLVTLHASPPAGWDDIASTLTRIKDKAAVNSVASPESIFPSAANGTAFLTFEYGLDGVSVEIAKYARALESALQDFSPASFHLIGGDFHPHSDRLFNPDMPRYRLPGANGWSKWDGGKWFSALFYIDMPENSEGSNALANEIFSQALSIADSLGNYILNNNISLLIPVNIASNPGNIALTLALVLVSEALGLAVINSNHDFYWEGGRPADQRAPGAPPGVRDHFFRNMANRPFFDLFRSQYPWNGKHWLQVNINSRQSTRLVERFSFPPGQVSELPTSVPDALLEPFTFEHVQSARQRMARILADGSPTLETISLHQHIDNLTNWMADQQPLIIGVESGLVIDPASPHLIYLLQPTRLVARKRIPRDIDLIQALLRQAPFQDAFASNPELQIVLHITGPVPIEHRNDLLDVLHAYRDMANLLPDPIAKRIFLAFSVGREEHPSFSQEGLASLRITDIYRMATAVLFPSQTEGRGLPIIEAAAIGVPIICSRYQPESVFAEVVGEHLPAEDQLQYTLFPEGDFSPEFLKRIADLLLQPQDFHPIRDHNQAAVRTRFSRSTLTAVWKELLERLAELP